MTLENSKRICSLRLLNNNDSYELKIKWKKENKTAKIIGHQIIFINCCPVRSYHKLVSTIGKKPPIQF